MTNHTYHMGTPALAAQFVAKVGRCCQRDIDCDDGCPIFSARIDCEDYRELKEWMESEVD